MLMIRMKPFFTSTVIFPSQVISGGNSALKKREYTSYKKDAVGAYIWASLYCAYVKFLNILAMCQ